MSHCFDWKFYLAYYPDLKLHGLVTQKQAIMHYRNAGIKEGRVCNKSEIDFSERLSDMIEINKNDKKDFIKHIRFWNWKAYKHSHDDLKNMSQDGLLKHVLTHGIQENRHLIVDKKNTALISKKTIQNNFDLLLPDDFNWNSYLSLNKNLPNLNEVAAKTHYILHGAHEERDYKNNVFVENSIKKNQQYKYYFICTAINSGDYCTATCLSKNIHDSKIIVTTELNSYTFNEQSWLIFLDYSQLKIVDITKFNCIKIAWARNSERKWLAYLNLFDYVLCCTNKAKNFFENNKIKSYILPIGGNFDEYDFNQSCECDIFVDCNLFNRRSIVDIVLRLKKETNYKIKICGKNWNKYLSKKEFELIKDSYYEFIKPENIKEEYLSSKIIIDDCNITTIEFGSVNKRVIDCITCKRLVLTDNLVGSEELFENKLLTYKSYDELNGLIIKYLNNSKLYDQKANELYNLCKEFINNKNILKFLSSLEHIISNTNNHFSPYYTRDHASKYILVDKNKIKNNNIPDVSINLYQKVSVIILNWDRPANVMQTINNLIKCENVDEIIISNGKKETNIIINNDIIKSYDDSKLNEVYGLNLRFYHALNARNEKVLIIDDDIKFPNNVITKLITLDTNVIIGFYGRNCSPYSGIPEKNIRSCHYSPIVLTKIMLMNKNLAKKYMELFYYINDDKNNNNLGNFMKKGKPFGNGEDILINAISLYLTNKINIVLNFNMNLDLKKIDVGSHDKKAICNRYKNTDFSHYKFRVELCKMLYQDQLKLTFEFKKLLTICFNLDRIKFYFGNYYNYDNVKINKENKNLYNFENINKFFKKHNKHYSEPFKKLLVETNNTNKYFLAQFGDRCIRSTHFDSWSFTEKITDDYSFVKIRKQNEKNTVILKCLNFVRHWQSYYTTIDYLEFTKKKDILIWRGANTGNINSGRFIFLKKWGKYNNNFDVGFSKLVNQYDEETFKNIKKEYSIYIKDEKKINDLLNYKYILSLEGNDKDSGLNWKLNSNSVVFMCKPTVSSWLMEENLIPNYHYIEIKSDFSDVEEKLKWCMNNQNKCLEIIKNSNDYMKMFLNIEQEKILEQHIINLYFKKI